MKMRIFWVLSLILFISACNQAPVSESPDIIEIKVTEEIVTEEASLTPIPTDAFISTIEPTLTPTPYIPFAATVWADGVNLRAGPGLLFPVLHNLAQNTEVAILARAPGSEWFYVRLSDNQVGWLSAVFVESQFDFTIAPIMSPRDAADLWGFVKMPNDIPVEGVHFAVTQGDLRADGTTNEIGQFVVFFPYDVKGEWQVSYVGINCASSVMDENCECQGEFCNGVNPPIISITLPYSDTLHFVWQ